MSTSMTAFTIDKANVTPQYIHNIIQGLPIVAVTNENDIIDNPARIQFSIRAPVTA
jgi:hypothetical protein